MMTLLVLRARLRSIYQKYERYITPIAKFIVAIIVFQLINNAIGYDDRFKRLPIVLVLSLISAFTPFAVLVLLAAVVSILHVYFMSKILSVMIIMIMLVMYFLFIRFTPKLGCVILVIPILNLLKLPYLVPILLGLFTTPISIVPTSCGVIVFFLFKVIKEATAMDVNLSIENTLQLYTYVANQLINNKQMFMTIIIFSIIIIVTYFIRQRKFDYAHEISIAAGTITCILGFLISDLKLDISEQIGYMILGTIASAILAFIAHFFYLTLDYTGVEHVQFEDDDYYYYVKAVPKINVTTPEINVKRINAQKINDMKGFAGNMNNDVLSDEDYDYDEDYEEFESYDIGSKNDVK